jgi:hypothetical protein
MYKGMQYHYHVGLVVGLVAVGTFAFAFRCWIDWTGFAWTWFTRTWFTRTGFTRTGLIQISKKKNG